MLLSGRDLESIEHMLINPGLCCPALMKYLWRLRSRLRQPPEKQWPVLISYDNTTSYRSSPSRLLYRNVGARASTKNSGRHYFMEVPEDFYMHQI